MKNLIVSSLIVLSLVACANKEETVATPAVTTEAAAPADAASSSSAAPAEAAK